MVETLAYGYSSENAQRELSNEFQNDSVLWVFKDYLRPFALDESILSIGRVKWHGRDKKYIAFHSTNSEAFCKPCTYQLYYQVSKATQQAQSLSSPCWNMWNLY